MDTIEKRMSDVKDWMEKEFRLDASDASKIKKIIQTQDQFDEKFNLTRELVFPHIIIRNTRKKYGDLIDSVERVKQETPFKIGALEELSVEGWAEEIAQHNLKLFIRG